MKPYEIKDYTDIIFQGAYRLKAYQRISAKVKSVAIYKSGGGLGDLVQSIPLFRSFKQMFPISRITYLGLYQRPRCDTLFKNLPYIDQYLEYIRPGKQRTISEYSSFRKQHLGKFDLIVDTQSKFPPSFYLWLLKPKYFLSRNPLLSSRLFLLPRTKVHVVAKMLALVRVLGFEDANFSPVIDISEDYLAPAKKYLSNFPGPFISIIPGAGHPYKMWDKQKFALLADRLYAMGYQVILLGAESEAKLLLEVAQLMKNKPIVPLVQEPKFGQDPIYSIGLCKSSLLTVGCDCGGLHLATLSGCPVIGIYGPTNPDKSGPLGNRNMVIYKRLNCSPCRMKECHNQHSCLQCIGVEEVVAAAKCILKKVK